MTDAERITQLNNEVTALEAEVRILRSAICAHRGHRDWVGNKIEADHDLWAHVANIPWGKPLGSRLD